MLQGVIFDMDGLLFDSERIWDTLWPECCRQMHLPLPPEEFYAGGRGMSGKVYADYVQGYFPQADAAQVVALFMRLGEERFAKPVPLKPGARELLEFLQARNIPCGVASSSSRKLIEGNLKNADMTDFFRVVVSGQDVTHTKPDPAIFLLTAERLGVDIRRCLVLEDSPNGIRAGHAAGAVTIMIPDMIPPNDDIAKLYTCCCKDLFEVRDLLEQGKLAI